MKEKIINIILILLFLHCNVFAYTKTNEEEKGIFSKAWDISKSAVLRAWNGDIYDLYIPVNTWHNRSMYDKFKTDRYNEKPYGAGLGKTRIIPENNNLEQIYFMIFSDSHKKPEFITGYNYIWRWGLDSQNNFNVGLGATVGFTIRTDFSTPLALPILQISYKFISAEATYIPGKYNSLNVLFSWIRLSYKF